MKVCQNYKFLDQWFGLFTRYFRLRPSHTLSQLIFPFSPYILFLSVNKKNLKNYRRLVNVAGFLDSTREPAYFRLHQSTSLS